MQGVEFSETNNFYWCTTCSKFHEAKQGPFLNLCVAGDQLHNLHTPRLHGQERCDPDPVHIDWLTTERTGGSIIPELETAFVKEYGECTTPMRILLVAGEFDFIRGRSQMDIIESILHFQMVVYKQNSYHKHTHNEFVVATILNPPSICWYENNGPLPNNYTNHLKDLLEINSWIVHFNQDNGKEITPRIHRYGVKDGHELDTNGKRVKVKKHNRLHWCEPLPLHKRSLLSVPIRLRIVRSITRHFQGEIERFFQQ